MLAADALFCPACGTARSRDAGGDPLMGAVIGDRFLILDRIGHGGSGTIYRGEHVTLRRKVAIKVLHHELSKDDLAIERFRREATTVSEIDNEHIVEIHDFGRTPDGRLYLAMELLEGESLQEVLKRERQLPIERASEILLQLGEALVEAHAMGYVHRDLRPRNIYLAMRRNRQNFVKLLDFGLAKLVEHGGEMQQTNLGMTFGDPKYMSPEQARGEALDRRADIYSLGCIGYEMLVGEPPFTGSKVFDILTKHVDSTPPTPRERRSDVPLWLDSIVGRMLAKRPGDRFVTVFQLVEALRHGLSTGQVWKPPKIAEKPGEQPAVPTAEPAGQEAAEDGDEQDWSDKTQPGIAPASLNVSDTATDEVRLAKPGKSGGAGKGKVAPTIKIVAAKPAVAPEAKPEAKNEAKPEAKPEVKNESQVPEADIESQEQAPPVAAAAPKPEPVTKALEDSLTKTLYLQGPKGRSKEASANEVNIEGARAPERASSKAERAGSRAESEADKKSAGRPRPDDEPAAHKEAKTEGRGDKKERSAAAALERASAARRGGAEPDDSQSGLATAWFADGDRNKDEELDGEFRERLMQARATILPGDTGRLEDDLYYDPSRKPLVKVAAAIGGVLVVILLLVVAWPSGDKPETATTANSGTTSAATVIAQLTADASPPDAAQEPDVIEADAGVPTADAGTAKPAVTPAVTTTTAAKPAPEQRPGNTQPAGGTATKPRPPSDTTDEPIKPVVIDSGAGKPAATLENVKQAEFFAKLGQQALQSGNVGGAASNFKKALELDPKNFDAALGQGEIALRAGSYDYAIGHFKKAAKLRPRSAQVQVLLGEAYLSAGKDSLAANSFKLALKLDPDNARAQEGYKEAAGRAAAPLQDPY